LSTFSAVNMNWPDYELLDFGDGRKLERFGELVLDRPCPTAHRDKPRDVASWKSATGRFVGDRATEGEWWPPLRKWATKEWTIRGPEGLAFEMTLAPLPSGQVGVFPEQAASWQWIAQQVTRNSRPLKILNLFAYTGGSTLAAASAAVAAGREIEIVHVDAASSAVERASCNAELSQLTKCNLRWIVEDATKFCEREVRRGNRYDAVILDPPTYGHGPKGDRWTIHQDLLPLISLCGELTEHQPAFALATCHTPEIGVAEIGAYLCDGLFGSCAHPPATGKLTLVTADDRVLPSGVFSRWPG
jgi:23S rRNA (cytosine1962-C5)-methyltransferase